MEYVYGTSVIRGVERENLKIVGGPALREGEYLTTVREYDDSSITDRCRIDRHYHSDTDEDGTRYDFYTISEHYRYVERIKVMEETRKIPCITNDTCCIIVHDETTRSERRAGNETSVSQ